MKKPKKISKKEQAIRRVICQIPQWAKDPQTPKSKIKVN